MWRKNFEIKRVDLNIAAETLPGFSLEANYTVGRIIIKKAIWVAEKLDNTGTYFLKDELRELISETIKNILQNPSRVDRVHKQTIVYNKRYFDFAETIRKIDLTKLSNKKLLALHKRLYRLQYLSHTRALPTTWFVDSDGEDFTKRLIALVENKIKARGLTLNPASAFSILTTPSKTSYAQKEEQESLRIVAWIKSRPKLKRWFMRQTTAENPLLQSSPCKQREETKIISSPSTGGGGEVGEATARRKILRHHYRWCWTPYNYLGPAYGLDYYLEVWRGLLREGIDACREITAKKKKARAIQRERRRLIKALELSAREKHWFDIAADIVWLKGYRKDCYYHGFFVLDLLLGEMACRSGLSLLQAKHLLREELPRVLAGEDLSDLANERMKFCVLYCSNGRLSVMTGAKARNFLKQQKFEKVKIAKVGELRGTCACPGRASGTVRVVNLPEEMSKMHSGDIMLAHTTFPALVPAMKKAAAIITEDGGITCHAAIVARELQTPCVVGCKHALQILKDGDKVEVDAERGVVRKI